MAVSILLKATEYTKTAKIVAGEASAESYPDASQRKLRGMYDEFSSDTAYDATSVISFGLLPKGSRVLGFFISWEAQGAAVTVIPQIGGVTAGATTAAMTNAGSEFVPALEVFQGTKLTADSIVSLITAAQDTGIDDSISVTTVYLDED